MTTQATIDADDTETTDDIAERFARELVEARDPGRYLDLPEDEYHSDTAVSRTETREVFKSIDHWKHHRWPPEEDEEDEEDEQPDQYAFGSALHDAVLLPDVFEETYVKYTKTKTRRAKTYKKWKKDNPDKVGLTPDEFDQIDRMVEQLKEHPTSRELLFEFDGLAEVSYWWVDEETGLICRCRVDRVVYTEEGIILVDLKSTRQHTASPSEFRRKFANYKYEMQAAMYADGVSQAEGIPVVGFYYPAVEKDRPHGVCVHRPDSESVAAGRDKYKHALGELKKWLDNPERWTGYPADPVDLTLPVWALEE